MDFQIVCDRLAIFGESKWTSDVARDQGRNKDKDQMKLRMEFLEKYGQKIFSKTDKQFVLLVELEQQKFGNYPYVSWEDVRSRTDHPLKDEVKDYYLWEKECRQ